MEDPNLGQFTDDLANMMQGSIEQETGNAGLLDLNDLTQRFQHEIEVLTDYQAKLAEYRGSVENAIKLVEKRIKAINSAVAVLQAPEPFQDATPFVVPETTAKTSRKKAA